VSVTAAFLDLKIFRGGLPNKVKKSEKRGM